MDPKALYSLTYGLHVIGASNGKINNAQIINTLIQVTSQPLRVSICINKNNFTHELLKQSRAFSASILEQDTPLNYIGSLGFKSGRDGDKLAGLKWKKGQTGAPILTDYALSYLEVKVTGEQDIGTHTMFIGEVVAAEVIKEGEPLTYAYYQKVKKGTTPKTAPSYIEKKEEKAVKMDKYECGVCGYIYDPAAGDPESKIPPGTPFEKLPDNWVCPVCGAGKDEFKKVA
ncbi:MAG: rubredoxin [Dehalococcoidia bacterium]|nr:rubredoxin [Dehalococcoidia bacterium]